MSENSAASEIKNFILIHLIPSKDEVFKINPVHFRTAGARLRPCLNTPDDHFHALSFETVISSKCMP